MGRRVMDRESVPDFGGHFDAEDIGQRLPAVDIEVVHHQVNGLCFRILQRQSDDNLSELKGRTVGCREGEMSPRFRLYCAENVGSSATLIFIIPPCFPSRRCWPGGPHVGGQGDRLLVYTDHRLFGVIRPLVHLQYVFHLGDIVIIEIGHYRGREGTSARRWARWTSRRSWRTSRTKSGRKTIRASRSPRLPSLEPA